MIPRNTIVVNDNMIKELYQEHAKFEKELEEYSSWSRTLKDTIVVSLNRIPKIVKHLGIDPMMAIIYI